MLISEKKSETSLAKYLGKDNKPQDGIIVYEPKIKKGDNAKKKEVINFSVYDKNKYLLDNEFIYMKRIGNPIEFIECIYMDLCKSKNKNKKKGNKYVSNKIEYITMSRNVKFNKIDCFAPYTGEYLHISC